jgi:1-deoxy-D-xylulose-5-phosphate reductoisomerase
VAAFLADRISFSSIPEVIAAIMDTHDRVANPGLEEILDADRWARRQAGQAVAGAAHRSRTKRK